MFLNFIFSPWAFTPKGINFKNKKNNNNKDDNVYGHPGEPLGELPGSYDEYDITYVDNA